MLVDRLWPRGLPKAGALFDVWMKELAPSSELRKWYGHESQRFEEFERRYRAELARPPASTAFEELAALAVEHDVVLLTAAEKLACSAAAVLQRVLAGTSAAA